MVFAPVDALPEPDQVIPGKLLRPDLLDFLERRVHGFSQGLCDLPGVQPVVGFGGDEGVYGRGEEKRGLGAEDVELGD